MTGTPLVTVLMAVYNGEKYLKATIQSILKQTYRDFEFLIIDDCSSDNSQGIIESFNDKRIVIYKNAKNIGQTKSLNIGLKLAKGKYIARMDADDMAFPRWIEKILAYLECHPLCAAAGSAAVVMDGNGKRKEIRRAPNTSHGILFKTFFAPPMNHVSVILNKELILENGGYNEDFMITQDYELWSSLIRNNRILANIPEILVSYRVHSNSIGYLESSKKGAAEKSETIFRNINCLTNLRLKLSDAVNICRLFYHTSELSTEDFMQAQNNFENIYAHLKENFKIPSKTIRSGIKAQMLKPYCKLAVSEIMNNRIHNARNISLSYCNKYGFNILPFLIFLSSLAGSNVYKKLPLYYEWLQETKTKILLK